MKVFPRYILALLLMGSNGIIASFIELGSTQIVLIRSLLGSILLIAIFLLSGHKFTFLKNKKSAFYLVLSGFATGISWMCLYEAYERVGVSIASLLCYCGPVIVILLSPLLFKERLTAPKIIGFISVVIGVFFLNGVITGDLGDIIGIICGLGSAVTYAVMVVCNKFANDIEGLERPILQLVFAFLTTAVFVGITQGFSISIPASSILPMLFLGFVNTGIGCFLYFSAMGKLPVQTVAICGYIEPLSAVIFSALILKEVMLPLQIVGAVLILGGAMVSELIKTKEKTQA